MITRLRLQNFKNFADAELKLGAFTVILGTNASGKSNIRDAFRFLHGIGRGYSLTEIISGKWGSGGQREWAPIRGANNEICRNGSDSFTFSSDIIYIDSNFLGFGGNFTYEMTHKISTIYKNNSKFPFSISRESFDGLSMDSLYSSSPSVSDPVSLQDDDQHLLIRLGRSGNHKKLGKRLALRFDQPALSQISDNRQTPVNIKMHAEAALATLGSMGFLDLVPEKMRNASPPGQLNLGDSGENLPTVLQAICAEPASKETLMEWVRALTPMDVVDFKFRTDLNGFVQLYLVESDGAEISAVSASDGTLRFLALLAALLGPNPAKLYFFEEIESGIHPARLHLLIDMLERQTAKSGIQVVTTTHSPELLSLLSDETLKSTSIVYRPSGRSDAIIKPVLEFPNIEELRQQPGLGHLHATGWFERALSMMDGKQAAE